MTQPRDDLAAAPAPPAPPRPFRPWLTAVFSLVIAAHVVGLPLVWPLFPDSQTPLERLDRPEESLARLVTREMDLRAVLRREAAWEWRIYLALGGGEDPIREAVEWYGELADAVASATAGLARLILLAEAGETDTVSAELDGWAASGEEELKMAGWLRAAYLEEPPTQETGRALLHDLRRDLDPGWFRDALTARLAARIGDRGAVAQAEAATLARGRVLLARLHALAALGILLVLGGAVAVVAFAARPARLRVAGSPGPPGWTLAEGYALFARALGTPLALSFVLFFVLRTDTPFDTLISMGADLPLFGWVAWYFARRGTSWPRAFGLAPARSGALRAAAVAAGLASLAMLGDAGITLAANALDIRSHWTDGFFEQMLWEPRWRLAVDSFNVIVWAPVVEELSFRGLLFGALRARLGLWPAALASAAVFTAAHGYGAIGSASVFVSGVLWAVAYERTGSLLPGMLAHSANNLMSTLWTVAMLR
ncbi:MAG TPA: CPBP family intramembrane glutamic endopeptidase [Methylomirabilota bacterium]|nr:CPBP family intramembrane glutamic endopeptidase [Methylomirabilota bacterium]